MVTTNQCLNGWFNWMNYGRSNLTDEISPRSSLSRLWVTAEALMPPLEVLIFNFLLNISSSDLQLRIDCLTFVNFQLRVGGKCLFLFPVSWQISSPPTPLPPFLTSSSLTLKTLHSQLSVFIRTPSSNLPQWDSGPLNYFPFGLQPLRSHPPHRWPSEWEQPWESVGRLI